jgi:SpoVK/Ycf46/Vps4 family AAA+-type ATPase
MSRVEVKPFVQEEPHVKGAVSPHLEWALEVLHRVRAKDAAFLERIVGTKMQGYSKDVQGMLNILSDVGPSLETRDEWMSSDSIERELQGMIGLSQVKTQLKSLRKSLKADARRREQGTHVPKMPPHHLVFVGNPGVGKTSMARLVAKIFKEVGATKRGHLVEVQREDLVGQHVGTTAPKTRKVINAAKGGVLFVDEAYRLTGYGSESRDFGPEAVEEIMKDLDDGDPVVIIAGYGNQMERFFDANPGLRRRFRNTFFFTNYSPHEMACMFKTKVLEQGFFMDPIVTVSFVANLIMDNTTEAWRAERNGCVADLLFDSAKSNLDERLCLDTANRWELQTLSCDDIRRAAAGLQGDGGVKL